MNPVMKCLFLVFCFYWSMPWRGLPDAMRSVRLTPCPPTHSGSLFEKLPASFTGVDLVHEFPTNAPFDLLIDQCSGAGVCAGDYDGDGWPDLYVTAYDRGNRLYRNTGNWIFTDVTERAGVGGSGRWCTGATFADVDNDRDLDLFVCVFNAPNLLFVNRGDGTFDEQARARGLDFRGGSVMMYFCDYDVDGFLDAYLVTHRLNVGSSHKLPRTPKEMVSRGVIQVAPAGQISVAPRFQELFATLEKGNGRTELIIAGQEDYLYHNNRDGTFSVSNSAARIHGRDIGLAATWWDFNDDGLPDLYVSNDYRGPDRLYRNEGNGTFTEVAAQALPHAPWSSMGADLADINNDGHIDLLAADMAGSTHYRRQINTMNLEKDRWFLESTIPPQYPRNAVFLGTGTDRVMEVAYLTGLANTDWTWSPKFADLDNDGWTDLFLTTGMSRDFVNNDLTAVLRERGESWRNAPVLRQPNLAFRNLGDLQFRNASADWGLDQVSASYGAAFADLDRDGDLDLVVTSFGEPVSVYRNTGTQGYRVLIRLIGTRSNSWGTGARATLEGPSSTQTKVLTLASGFASANEPLLHFGLGADSRIHRLTLRWPSGLHQSFTNLLAGQFYTITEPAFDLPKPNDATTALPLFSRSEHLLPVRHREQPFEDFQREPLLPWKLSQMGPGLAIGDANGDGLEDIYLGGAAGQSGMLSLRDQRGAFQLSPQPCFELDKACEDVGACFFDADGDGDQDLFVVSGGVECEAGSPLLRDRLYLNDGKGQFAKAPSGATPDERDSGSVVACADFDRDGDLDLFVGGGSIPGSYPLPARSQLLINQGGRLTDLKEDAASGLGNLGLVTSAVWSDADGDGWLDLLATAHWSSIRLFRSNHGRLEDRTREAGLSDAAGLWNGIAPADLDGDGDMDYVATNFGLNTRYRASPKYPALLFYGSFDSSGTQQLIEAYYEDGVLLPVRGKSCLAAAIPSLQAKFPTFDAYAHATLPEIFAPKVLSQAQRLAITSLESMVLLNDGTSHFELRLLPRLAQAAPSFGVALTDFDGDAKVDLCLAQNFFSPQPESGRMDGGLGLLLLGRGDGGFAPVPPKASGLLVHGDAKGLVLTDLNRDGWPDVVFALNDSEPCALTNGGSPRHRVVSVRLAGKAGNPTAVGARVHVTLSDGSRQAAEVYAGGGYLSQSQTVMTFGLGETSVLRRADIRWPDGRETSERPRAVRKTWVLQQP